MSEIDGDLDKEIAGTALEKLMTEDVEQWQGVKLRKMTPASVALLEMAKLKMLYGDSDCSVFEILAFLFIHSRKPREARRAVLDKSLGKDEDTGRNVAFINMVMDWGEDVNFTDLNGAAKKIEEMVKEAFGGQVEPIANDDPADKVKKKEEVPLPNQ